MKDTTGNGANAMINCDKLRATNRCKALFKSSDKRASTLATQIKRVITQTRNKKSHLQTQKFTLYIYVYIYVLE